MTSAPRNLLDVRSLLLAHLGQHGLLGAEVGIVGDVNHWGGYHCGSARVVRNDYSVVESSRDRNGLSDFASALDVGTFTYGPHNLRTFSVWLVRECAAGAADTRGIREIIYSHDGRTVRRWDRLGRRTDGDSSHLFHTHISFFRDATKAGRDLTGPFRRYLAHVGLIKPAPLPPVLEAMMELHDKLTGTDNPNRTVGDALADLSNLRNYLITPVGKYKGPGAPQPGSPLDLIVKALSGK